MRGGSDVFSQVRRCKSPTSLSLHYIHASVYTEIKENWLDAELTSAKMLCARLATAARSKVLENFAFNIHPRRQRERERDTRTAYRSNAPKKKAIAAAANDTWTWKRQEEGDKKCWKQCVRETQRARCRRREGNVKPIKIRHQSLEVVNSRVGAFATQCPKGSIVCVAAASNPLHLPPSRDISRARVYKKKETNRHPSAFAGGERIRLAARVIGDYGGKVNWFRRRGKKTCFWSPGFTLPTPRIERNSGV